MSYSSFYGNRSIILNALNLYYEKGVEGIFKNYFLSKKDQHDILKKIIHFIENEENCFLRSNLAGHVTGSAIVANKNFSKVLMTFHAKLKKWLQLGGHCDGDFLVHNVALKEANEESGLAGLKFIDFLNFPNIFESEETNAIIPFDIDIHQIPQWKSVPIHYHYDIRYLLFAENEDEILISEESLDLRWIPINDISLYTDEPSTIRQIDKLKMLLQIPS